MGVCEIVQQAAAQLLWGIPGLLENHKRRQFSTLFLVQNEQIHELTIIYEIVQQPAAQLLRGTAQS